MSSPITLPDETYQLMRQVAAMEETSVEGVIAHLLYKTLPLTPSIDPNHPVETLPDDDLLALTQITLTPEADQRHLLLLQQQQQRSLSPAEQKELSWFTQIYGIATLYKTKAMIEAAQRGLISL